MTGASPSSHGGRKPFLRPFLIMAVLGLVGILSLIPTLAPLVTRIRDVPGVPDLPEAALVLLLLVQPTLLMLAGVALGVALAERAGLVSWILRRIRGEPAALGVRLLPSTLLLSAALSTAVVAIDLAVRARFPDAYGALPQLGQGSPANRLAGPFFGGITEELMMRFGLMSALVALGARALGARALGRRPAPLLWAAILVSAFVFAAAHLTAVAQAAAPEGVILVRTIGLNALLGTLYGWLYWTRNLEHAMVAHAATHGVFWIAAPLLAALMG
jgi:CAAX prenyl protease-like protein